MTKTIGKKRTASESSIRKNTLPRKKKRLDLQTITNIGRVSTHYTTIKLPKTVIKDLKRVYDKSSYERVEYAGSVKLQAGNTLVKTVMNSPGTSKLRGAVASQNVRKYMFSYLSYHTHPSSIFQSPTKINRRTDKFFTTPTLEDLLLYIDYYPEMQANLVLDENGYYVIDIIESVKLNRRPSKTVVRDIYSKFQNYMISQGMSVVFEEKYLYYRSSHSQWKTLFNDFARQMLTFSGVSMKYYMWDEEPATITISNKNIR
jgi:hypothetical protein